MIIKRDYYLNQLIDGMHNGMVKIITGIRRCGKSFLLFELFSDYLKSHGVDDSHIIKLNLDDYLNKEYRKPDVLLKYIYEQVVDADMYYVLLDEVQMVEDFVEVLNSLLHRGNIDAFVTGSNSKFLSTDIVTEFRGRGDVISLYPLSFSEFYSAYGGDKSDCWREYTRYGGLPQILSFNVVPKKINYLQNVALATFVRDVIERHRVKNVAEIEELLQILASSIGAPCNPTRIANTFKSLKHVNVSNKTINNYISYFLDAFVIEKAQRYDVKGRKYINSLSKYYFTDIGVRNALVGFRQVEESHIMENVIYNELLIRGYSVDVGAVEKRISGVEGSRQSFEVDFVANQGSQRYYIQSALYIPDAAKMAQETASLKNINDTFKKIVIVKDNIEPWHDDDGILFLGLYDFLLKGNALEM